jgi:trigger factor
MQRELATAVRSRLKQQLLDRLLAANPVDVPKTLVDSQVREMQIDTARRMGATDASQIPPVDSFLEPARRRVALGILISELIKRRGIELDQEKVGQRLQEIASDYPDPEEVLKAYRQNSDAMRQIESIVLEEQVVDYLLERAKVADQPATFKELMNFGG